MNIKTIVEPSPFVPPTRTIHNVSIQVINLVLYQSATLLVSLCEEDGRPIETKVIQMEGNDYALWDNDDSYVVDFVLQQFSLTKKAEGEQS